MTDFLIPLSCTLVDFNLKRSETGVFYTHPLACHASNKLVQALAP